MNGESGTGGFASHGHNDLPVKSRARVKFEQQWTTLERWLPMRWTEFVSMETSIVEAHSAQRSPRRLSRSLICRVLIGILSAYFSVGVAVAALQHRLIYKPLQRVKIDPGESRLERMAVSTIHIPTHDGLVLNGWRATPLDRIPRCSVLFFHGNFGNRTWCWRTLKMFQDLGVEVWLIDYRGYGDNSGVPNEADCRKDARSTWSLMTDEYGIQPDQIVICGYSLGGAVAVGLASELCASGINPRGLVTLATFPSLAEAAAERFPLLPVRLVLSEQWPSAVQIRKVTCPILHIHGAADRIVPLKLGRELFSAAPSSSTNRIPKQLVELPGCDHLTLFRTGLPACSSSIDGFLVKILNGRATENVIATTLMPQ